MATLFPGSTDNGTSLPYPSALSKRNGPSLAGLNDNQNDAIIATQTKLGTSASTPTASNLLVGTGVGTSSWSKLAPTGIIVGSTDTITLTNKTLTSPTITSPIITNASLTTDLISGFTSPTIGTIYGLAVNAGVITTAGYASSTALQTNAVQGNQLSSNAITLGYAEVNTSQTGISTEVALTGLLVTVTIPTGGRRIKITGYGFPSSSANGDQIKMFIKESSTYLGQGTVVVSSAFGVEIVAFASFVPSAGSHTYNLSIARANGTGIIVNNAAPANSFSGGVSFILVEAI